jgi:hypothetical protein
MISIRLENERGLRRTEQAAHYESRATFQRAYICIFRMRETVMR